MDPKVEVCVLVCGWGFVCACVCVRECVGICMYICIY